MKILFSITYYHPYVSGLTLAASRWAEGLKKKGHRVRVLCLSGIGPGVIAARPLVRVSKGFLSWDWIIQSWHQVRQNDVVVINLPQFEGIIPALFGRVFGKRVVAIYHCEIVMPSIQWILEISHMMTLLLSDVVVSYTRDYAKHSKLLKVLKLLKQGNKIKTIVPPIPKPKENKALTARLRKTIGDADYVIGVAARLAREKGIEYLLDALPHMKGKIVIAGPMEPVGEEAYKEKIKKLVKKYKQQVVFFGEIPPEYMGSFYRLIDVLVLPSVNSTEAFGMVQVEAMHWGVPVVASNLPGVRVPVQKTGMGLVVPPKDPEQLANAIFEIRNQKPASISVDRFFSEKQSIDALNALCTS